MAEDHDCRAELLARWNAACEAAAQGPIEITVSTEPPLVFNGWTEGYDCPHGTTYYIEPTGEQRAKWAREARHT